MKIYRFLMVVLASFGAAFAYLCKNSLNAIHTDIIVGCNGSDAEAVNQPQLQPRTEEQAIFAMLLWQHRRQSLKKMQVRANRTHQDGIVPLTGELARPGQNDSQESNDTTIRKLDWTETATNNLLVALFVGYFISMIPGGRAAEIFGAKTMLLVMGAGSGLLTLVWPPLAKMSIWAAGVARFFMGVSQGALFPALYVFLCEWLPQEERSKWFSVPATISRIGMMISYLAIPSVFIDLGWEAVFYGLGVFTLIWTTLFLVFASNKPSTSRWIGQDELLHIESKQEPSLDELNKKSSLSASGFTINEPAKRPALSWLKILQSRPLYILSLVMFTSEWSNFIFFVKLSSYLRAWDLDIEGTNYWTAGLIAVFIIQYPLSNYAASRLETYLAPPDSPEKRQQISLRIRKVFEALAHGLQTIGCLLLAFWDDYTVVMMALFIIMFGRSTVGGGQCMMPSELSREFTGTVLAIANAIANIAPAIGPFVMNGIVTEEKERGHWMLFWILSAVLFALGGVIFCLFAENGPQDYGKSKQNLSGSLSMAQLCDSKSRGSISKIPIDEPIVMDVFSRVGHEPPKMESNKENKID